MQGMETPYAENPALWLFRKHPINHKLYQPSCCCLIVPVLCDSLVSSLSFPCSSLSLPGQMFFCQILTPDSYLATGETGSSVQLEGADLSQKLLNKLFSPQLYLHRQDESTAIELLLLHAAAHGLLGMRSWRGCCIPGKTKHSMGATLATERVFATGHSDKTEPY